VRTATAVLLLVGVHLSGGAFPAAWWIMGAGVVLLETLAHRARRRRR
jgi:hypothetical protein